MAKSEQIGIDDTQTILIIEDDDGIGMLLEEALLEEECYKVTLVNSSLKALEIVQKVRPTLFIADYRLPYVTGIEFYDRIQERPELKGAPFILISANLPIEEVKKRQITGIKKPFDVTKLINTVHQLTKTKR